MANDSKKEVFDIDARIIDSIKIGTGIRNVSVIGSRVYACVDFIPPQFKIEQYVVLGLLAFVLLLLVFALVRRTKSESSSELEPELSVEDLLVSTQKEEEKERRAKLKEIGVGEDSEVMQQIQKFAAERPEAVAQLLRNWMNEEWD